MNCYFRFVTAAILALALAACSTNPAGSDSQRNKRIADTNIQLGVAYMRLGETRNCCLRSTPESCILFSGERYSLRTETLNGYLTNTRKETSSSYTQEEGLQETRTWGT